jgi:O-acetylserine/cysteine efflux transporter
VDNKTKALLAIIILSILSGANSTVTKIGLVSLPPLIFIFFRFVIAASVLFIFVEKKSLVKDIKSLLPLSLFFCVNIVLFTFGIKLTSATVGQLLYAATPFITCAALYIIFREKFNNRNLIGVMIGFVGVILVILLPALSGKNLSGSLLGNILVGMAVISNTLFFVFSKKASKTYSPIQITFVNTFVMMIISIPLFVFQSSLTPNWWQGLGTSSFISVAYLAVVSTVIVYVLSQYAIKHGGAFLTSLGYYLQPIFAYFIASILLGEQLSSGLIVGAILIFGSVFLITTNKQKTN